MHIYVRQGSVTEGDETLLVNASNTNVTLGSGVSGAIRQACGSGYQEHIRALLRQAFGGPMEPGQVLITDAGTHPRARWVAHVAVMDYREGFGGSSFPGLETIRAGCSNLMRAIDALEEPVTIGMVALGAGTGQLGVREPTRIACEALVEYEASRPHGSKISACTFYGWQLFEYAAIAEVVTQKFPEVLGSIAPEARALFTGG
jgi:O-acetyl-ADP-ribose deacetylase (regulator of RNase III)